MSCHSQIFHQREENNALKGEHQRLSLEEPPGLEVASFSYLAGRHCKQGHHQRESGVADEPKVKASMMALLLIRLVRNCKGCVPAHCPKTSIRRLQVLHLTVQAPAA